MFRKRMQVALDQHPIDKKIHLKDSLRTYTFITFNLNALPITDIELKLMASAAIIGFNNISKNGYNNPAAIGIPITL